MSPFLTLGPLVTSKPSGIGSTPARHQTVQTCSSYCRRKPRICVVCGRLCYWRDNVDCCGTPAARACRSMEGNLAPMEENKDSNSWQSILTVSEGRTHGVGSLSMKASWGPESGMGQPLGRASTDNLHRFRFWVRARNPGRDDWLGDACPTVLVKLAPALVGVPPPKQSCRSAQWGSAGEPLHGCLRSKADALPGSPR